MTNKIHTISSWNAVAALHSALEDTKEEFGIFIIIEDKKQRTTSYKTANLTNAEAVFLLERQKLNIYYDE